MTIARVRRDTHMWAVVGCSPNPDRPSHGVSRTLMRHGYEMIPIYPHGDPDPRESPLSRPGRGPGGRGRPAHHPIEVVDIFRALARAGHHVDEAIAIGARAVWMQLDVIDEAAAERADRAGLLVVMDRCPAIDLGVFGLG